MIKIRVLHTDGRDELYVDVAKTTIAYSESGGQVLRIHSKIQTYEVALVDTVFVQHWEEDSE
jgi:hypothetical protein